MNEGVPQRGDSAGFVGFSSQYPVVHKALLTVLLYLLLGLLWIQWSDAAVAALFPDPVIASKVQTWKGWFFVIVTAALLYVVLYRLLRKDAELLKQQRLQQEELLLLGYFRESVIDDANIWINVIDTQARITLWNKAAEQISGYSRDDVVGKSGVWELLYPDADYRAEIVQRVHKILEDGFEVVGFETRMQCRDGQIKTMSWNQKRFFDGHGEVGSIAIGQDVTERNRLQQELERMAVHDPLTGLFNRRKFELLAEEALVRCADADEMFAMLWIDIDGFKGVNDRYGHQAGDDILRGVGCVLQEVVGERGIASRYGGDELVVALPSSTQEQAVALGARLRECVQNAHLLAPYVPNEALTVSVGVASVLATGTSIKALAIAADDAMYRAKNGGRNRVCT